MKKSLIFSLLILIGCAEEERKGKYHYPYKGAHLKCLDGVTWSMGMVNHQLKTKKDSVIPCRIIDPLTEQTEFAIETDGVVFIVEK